MNDTAPATIGDNRPPLAERLALDHEAILRRVTDLLAAADRLPGTIDDDDRAGKIGDYMKQLAAAEKALEAARVLAKEPYLENGRTVDGFFKGHKDKLANIRTIAQRRLNTYVSAKADRERKAREEAARLAREEAARQAEEARTEDDLTAAVEQEDAARRATKQAEAKTAELVRTRGEQGSLVSAATRWTHQIEDATAIPLEALRGYLPSDQIDAAVRRFVAAGGRTLPGVRIYQSTNAIIR